MNESVRSGISLILCVLGVAVSALGIVLGASGFVIIDNAAAARASVCGLWLLTGGVVLLRTGWSCRPGASHE